MKQMKEEGKEKQASVINCYNSSTSKIFGHVPSSMIPLSHKIRIRDF